MKKLLTVLVVSLMIGGLTFAAGRNWNTQDSGKMANPNTQVQQFVDEDGDGVCDYFQNDETFRNGNMDRSKGGRMNQSDIQPRGYQGNQMPAQAYGSTGRWQQQGQNNTDFRGRGNMVGNTSNQRGRKMNAQGGMVRGMASNSQNRSFTARGNQERGNNENGQFTDEDGDGVCDYFQQGTQGGNADNVTTEATPNTTDVAPRDGTGNQYGRNQ